MWTRICNINLPPVLSANWLCWFIIDLVTAAVHLRYFKSFNKLRLIIEIWLHCTLHITGTENWYFSFLIFDISVWTLIFLFQQKAEYQAGGKKAKVVPAAAAPPPPPVSQPHQEEEDEEEDDDDDEEDESE